MIRNSTQIGCGYCPSENIYRSLSVRVVDLGLEEEGRHGPTRRYVEVGSGFNAKEPRGAETPVYKVTELWTSCGSHGSEWGGCLCPQPHLFLPWPAVCDGEGPTSVLALARPSGQDHMNLVPLLLA